MIKRIIYSKKVIDSYIKKYGSDMKIPSNWNNHNLKSIASNMLYGNIKKAYIDFFNLSFFEQCIYFCRYGLIDFIILK